MNGGKKYKVRYRHGAFNFQSVFNASIVLTAAGMLGLLDALVIGVPVSLLLIFAGVFMMGRAVFGMINLRHA